ncbi:MAG: HAMP domain-containing histidine kinase [Blautia sp.]|nr:HAMP domain-containing histidine kinase [Lachnoclostridium sp.]MCM1210729.1 HAMP domain-containing histidine kinase [Blautia sp.]
MKIFANQKIKLLFSNILLCILTFSLIAALLMGFGDKNAAVYITISFLLMSAVILALLFVYFSTQHQIMENAISQITEYLSGNREVTMECNDEGELYRLFHEVNSLVAILNTHAEKEKNAKRFLQNTISDISHQLKTPLAALNIYIGLIQDEAKELQAIQEFSRLSEQELDRIEALVQNLLKITKLDAGMIVLEKSVEKVSEIAESVKEHFQYRARQEGKEICLSGSEEITFLCDCNWIIEAISNLVKNALDHTEKGGCIRIEWREFASIVQISVKDNGSGIYPEDLYHIFKRFYRSRYSQNLPDCVDKQGIGLGLPLTKAIVEAHNGTIEVDSTLGNGASFTMNFLLHDE